MAQHTPGPWFVNHPFSVEARLEPEFALPEGLASIDAPEGNHWGLAHVVVRMVDDTQESPELVANARLIAAAPDLLAALKEAHAALRHHPGGDTRSGYEITRASAAISKAEGR